MCMFFCKFNTLLDTHKVHKYGRLVFGVVHVAHLFSFLCCVLFCFCFLLFLLCVLCLSSSCGLCVQALPVSLYCLFLIVPSAFSNVNLFNIKKNMVAKKMKISFGFHIKFKT